MLMKKISLTITRSILVLISVALAFILASGATLKSHADSIPSRVDAAVQWAIAEANDDSHGYSLTNRWGPDYDCGTFVVSAFTNGGGFSFNGFVGTKSMVTAFTNAGFTWIPASTLGIMPNNTVPSTLKRGDIILDIDRHVELYVGNGNTAAAHSDRGNPQTGDQTGTEVSVSPYYNGVSGIFWDGVLRYTGSSSGNNSSNNSNSNKGSNTVKATPLKSVVAYDKTYTGKSQTPTVAIYDKNGRRVYSGYKLTTSGSTKNAGTVTVTVKGLGTYSGTVKTTYTIKPASASKATIAKVSTRTYNGKTITPKPSIKLNGKKLKRNVDYTLSATNKNTKGVVTATFKKNYKGKVSRKFKIKKAKLKASAVQLEDSKVEYNGTAQSPDVKVSSFQEGVDYTVSCSNNVNAGKATMKVKGTRMVTGLVTKNFDIEPKEITPDDVKVSEMTYTGAVQEPEITIEGLVKNKDFSVFFNDNDANFKNAGVHKNGLIIRGLNNYTGEIDLCYTIHARSLYDTKIEGVRDFTYNGKNQSQSHLNLIYSNEVLTAPMVLVENRDYTVSSTGGFKTIGKKKLQVKGINNFKDTLTYTFYIRPSVPKLSLKSAYNGATVKVKKVSGDPNYQIRIRKAGSSSWKTHNLKQNTVRVLTGLGRHKTYEVSVRAYKDGAYSEWSASETVKTA